MSTITRLNFTQLKFRQPDFTQPHSARPQPHAAFSSILNSTTL